MANRIVESGFLKSKQHFEILDGLKGLAAVVVVVFHFMEIAITDYNKNFISHGYLAVDFFALDAGATLAGRYQIINKISGDISYPLYTIHYPFVWIFLTYVAVQKPSFPRLMWVIPVSVILLISLSYLVFKFLDFPVRRYLTDPLKKYRKP